MLDNTTKAAISLPVGLFRQTDGFARQHKLSRSRLIAMALKEFFERNESRKMLDDLNRCYATEDQGDKAILKGWLRRQMAVVAKEPW